jgi:hypothetical protein
MQIAVILFRGRKLMLHGNGRQQSLSMQMENMTGGGGTSPEQTRMAAAAAPS